MENLNVSSLGEALSVGGAVALQGMSIVFLVLILLMIILMLMKVIFYKDPSKQKAEPKIVEKTAPTEEIKADNIDDEELVAVLTAAVAASLNTSTYNLRIKSYRRVGNNAPAWNKAGLTETVNHY